MAIFLPGWKLQGRLPSIGSLSRSGGFLAFVGSLPGHFRAGELLVVPKVISLVNQSLGPNGNDFVEFNRVNGIVSSIARRIAAAMPDAIVIGNAIAGVINGSATFNLGAHLGNNFVLSPSMPATLLPDGVPVVGCDFLCILVGSDYMADSQIDDYVAYLSGQLDVFARYTSRVFEQLVNDPSPGESPIGDIVPLANAEGIDIAIAGEAEDATEGDIAALISDHFGVTI